MDYTIFRERFNQLVKREGKTLYALSDAININPPTLSRYLSGSRTPDIPYIVKISKYFGVSVDWLLGVDEMSNGDTQADLKEIANLYAAASEDDRAVVRAVLKKYKIHPESNG